MYLDQAILRLNNINWSLVGTVSNKEDADVGYEFMRRLASFFKETQLAPKPPGLANVANLLGDSEGEIEIAALCNSDVVQFLSEDKNIQRMMQYYLQLARYADKNPDVHRYISIYDPLITLLERGGVFRITLRELVIKNGGTYPLNGWYERFFDKAPLDGLNKKGQ
ncbi:hypothetical protein [Paenibacillus sp. JJ-223]|uniref:hypothetical protein n=1 Tax=Paenibacillus sp. JJ-223 TaxID=2905647 RepID=UPI001F2C5E9F|nr:hypothetical protein [Paenibacillus sp. JJ-223]CAH1224487.1 hypothetical protein PAECIP111890_05675 [Paenibacillus sp. JJ-223]